jgi:hypothetical protein
MMGRPREVTRSSEDNGVPSHVREQWARIRIIKHRACRDEGPNRPAREEILSAMGHPAIGRPRKATRTPALVVEAACDLDALLEGFVLAPDRARVEGAA